MAHAVRRRERTASLALVAAVADMISSAGSVMDLEKYLSVNPDLSIHFHRIPLGDWTGLTSLVRVSADGYGQTTPSRSTATERSDSH